MIEYYQCELRKDNLSTLSWIPKAFAVVGKVLKLRQRGKPWDDGWTVAVVYRDGARHRCDRRDSFIACPELKT